MLINLCVKYIETYNALIKYKIKAYKENVSGERKIDLQVPEELPDIEIFQQEVLQILESKVYPDNFIYIINRLYLLSESNSDLLAGHNPVIKQLYKEYPITKELEQLSFGIYEFLRNEIFYAENEYGKNIRYQGLEFVQEKLPEFLFKNNKHILWSLYYFLPGIIKACLLQEQEDFNNHLLYYGQADTEKAIIDERNKRTDQIIELSKGFCDRNFIFAYLKGELSIKPYYFIGVILSELLESLSLEQYAAYTEFDYLIYPEEYGWNFGKKSLNEYTDLVSLPKFERLIQLLINVAFVLQLGDQGNIGETEKKATVIFETRAVDITETNPVLLLETQTEPEPEEPEIIDESEQEDFVRQTQSPQTDMPIEKENSHKRKPEYLLPVPILNQIYEEFNNELWHDITLMEFLNMFTTAIEKQIDFKLKLRQTARFYYLLKKIWLNCDQSLFGSEKEWIVPFLKNYNLSYSAYTNQFIANEGGVKHLNFTRSVDKLLPKEKVI